MNTPRATATARAGRRPRRWASAARLALLAGACLAAAVSAPAQNIQFTQGSVGSGLDNSIRIPLRAYPGRGAAGLHVTLNYSSKVWRVGSLHTVNNGSWYASIAEAIYAEHSAAGWTTSLDVPKVEWPKETDQYYYTGKPYCFVCGSGLRRFRVRRVYIHMPDGSRHELRENDQPYEGPLDVAGTFYAVDGSRLRYDSTGATTGTLYLPDGSRYVLSGSAAQFIDRNGNVLKYNAAARQWADPLGRAIGLPLPANPQAQDYAYTLPGFDGSGQTYTFRWKLLADALTPAPGTDDPPARKPIANDYLPHPDQTPTNQSGNNYPQRLQTSIPANSRPSLFVSAAPDDESNETLVVGRGQAGGELFNPVVLAEVVLPNGLSYKFGYNVYGEIDKVVYPTGAFDRYEYGELPPVGDQVQPYSQSNRGVTLRQLSPSGDGGDLAEWRYSGSSASIAATAPDGSYTVTKRHNIRAPLQPGTHSNPHFWAFGFEDSRNGMAYETAAYDKDPAQGGVMLRRTLTQWERTVAAVGPRINVQGEETEDAYRNARPVREVSIILDTGGDALAKTSTRAYDTAHELTTGVDLTEMTETHFAAVAPATAAAEAIGTIPAGALASKSSTAYENDQGYRTRHILGLVSSVTLYDAAGKAVSKTETFYDEADYPLLPPYNDLGEDAAYSDPGTTLRGNPTTVRSYVDPAASVAADQECTAGVCLETHARFDQYGNPVIYRDGRGIESQKSYSAAYKHAYLTGTTSAVPDPARLHGSDAAFTTGSTYDLVSGLALTTTDANGRVTEFSYTDETGAADPLSRLRKVTRPDGGWTKTTYNDVVGNLYAHAESSLDATRTTHAYQFFDKLGRAGRSYALEAGTTYVVAETQYDRMGRAWRVSNPFRATVAGTGSPTLPAYWASAAQPAHWTATSYDALGRAKQATLPDGTNVLTAYSGVYTTVTDQAGKQRRQKTNALGQIVRVDEPDADGNLGPADSPKQPSFYEYDTLGNVVRISQGLTSQTAAPEDPASYVQHRYFKYDALSRLTHERQAEQEGTISTPADPLTGNTLWSRRLSYDETLTDENSQSVSYPGLLTSAGDARGVVTRFFYDRLGRNYRVTYTDGTPAVKNRYDQERAGYFNLGRLTEAATEVTPSAPATAQVYDYDQMGRVARQRQEVGAHAHTLGYAYDLAGGLTSQTYPSGRVVEYGYDAAARLASVGSGATTYAGAMTYAASGGLESMTLGNGAVYGMSYSDARLQLTKISLKRGADTVQEYRYAYGKVDAATGAVDAAKNNGQVARVEGYIGAQRQWQQRFGYDPLGRLTSAGEFRGDTLGRTYLLAYDYDVYGNRRQRQSSNQNNPFAQAWVEDGHYDPATNRLLSGLDYDAAGYVRVDSRFRMRRYEYDANGRQRQSSNLDGSVAVQSVYDAAGQRVATKIGGTLTAVFVYDAFGQLAAEYGQAPASAATRYVVGDHQGSTRVVMSGAGAVVSRRDYLPFGEESLGAGVGLRAPGQGYGAADPVRRGYAGMERDDQTGMAHTLWREYDSLSARWTAPDPYGGSMEPASPQSFNRYAYVNNDPVNHVDPAGLMLSDIGVVQTDDQGKALRMERAMIKVLHRYLEGQTGAAQQQQQTTAQQRANAEFVDGMNASSSERFEDYFTRDHLVDAVPDSPGVDDRFHQGHYGPHVLSPRNGGIARSLPSLSGVAIYWQVQEAVNGKPYLYKVYVKPSVGDFIVVYEDLSTVSAAIRNRLPIDRINENSKVRVNAGDTIGTVRALYASDPENRSKIGLHVQFVKKEFFRAWHDNVKADSANQRAGRSLGAKSPPHYFINPCGPASPVRC